MVFWTQALGVAGWPLGIWVSGTDIHLPPHMWGWIALAVLCAGGYSYLLTRASSRGDISVVGPVLALAPIFSILPDWWLTDTLPRGAGWLGVGLSVVGTAGLSRTPTRRLDLRAFFSRGDALDALGSAVFLGVLAAVDRRNVLAMSVPSYFVAAYGVLAVPLLALVLARAPARSPTRCAPLSSRGFWATRRSSSPAPPYRSSPLPSRPPPTSPRSAGAPPSSRCCWAAPSSRRRAWPDGSPPRS